MGNIDLGKFKLRTDLIIENNEANHKKETIDGIEITSSYKDGNYVTISFEDITNFESREKVGKVLEKVLGKILVQNNISEEDECLIVGLGNIKSTPDSLGVKVINDILITKHLFKFGNVEEGIRMVSSFTPGVMANTGLESSNIIKAIIKEEKPKFVIVIDALASLSIDRINKTIQITDTGIHPGSGIGNNRKEISKNTIGIPVIAIGVPTVVTSTTIVYDTIKYLFKHISYIKDNEELNKLTFFKSKSYKNKIKDKKLTEEEENTLLGLFGSLDDTEKRSLINEVLTDIDLDLIVTPSEIDFLIDKLSNLIASAINNSLHRQISHY
ncbi:MAG: GPR endopeptidase [Bacilli bacterium]|nr:GPR endopeptidase [Bacilli bacterium]